MFFGRKKKIFIIDDNQDLVDFLGKMLESAHYEVYSAFKGEGAVDMVSQVKPDVIILDIMLPDIGGYELERIFQTDPMTRKIPIIYMTALASKDDEDLKTRVSTGRRRLLSKPVVTSRSKRRSIC